MTRRALALAFLTLILASVAAAENPLRNSDVVKLSKLGLGDEAVIAKIRQAKEVDFSLETDDLMKLKNSGVSSKVIAAMLDRSSGNSPAPAASAGSSQAAAPSSGSSTVKLVSSSGATALSSLVGASSSTYVYVTWLFWENFPGLRASARTTDHQPSFLIASDRDPRSRFYVVRVDVNAKDGDRSLKMGKSGAFSFKAGTAPDTDWSFAFEATEEKRGWWKVELKQPLKPGEYGVYAVQTTELYDFGVD